MRLFPNRGTVSACALAAAALSGLLTEATSARAATVSVPAGGDLQSALANAQPGDTILLAPGATYTGNFTLPAKGGSDLITIRSSAGSGLPGDGGRIAPADAPRLAKIRSPNTAPAIATAPGAHHWRLLLVELLANAHGDGDILALGDGSSAQASLAQVPHDLLVDRVYVHGDPALGQKRGIALNSAATTVTGCYIADIKRVGQDAQAIGGFNGPGPFTITNNYLEASGENVLFGGADPPIPNLVPADIVIRGNLLSKPPAWRTEPWTVKNLLELKNARRVTIDGNTLEYNWQGGQSGYAVLFTVRNQDGACPWCQVDHVTFTHNVVRHVAAGINILGADNNHPSRQTQAITIRNNLFWDIDDQVYGGNGYFLILTGQPRDITVDHNTIIQGHASGVIDMGGPPILGFVFTNNLTKHDAYGIIGDDHAAGNDSIGAYLPGSLVARNVLAGGSAGRYPADNLFPPEAEFEAQFVAFASGDFRLVPGSPWRGAGTDGLDLGASFDDAGGDPGGGGPAPGDSPSPGGAVSPLAVAGSLPPGEIGAAYAGALQATGGRPPYSWTISGGAVPGGVSLDRSSGTLAGEPQQFGTFMLTLTVTDSASPPNQASAQVEMTIAPRPVEIVTMQLTGSVVGLGYRASLEAAGGAAPYHWAVVSGQLPAGLVLDAGTGVISGAPDTPGRATFTIRVTDSWTPPLSATRTFVVLIRAGRDRGEGHPPRIPG